MQEPAPVPESTLDTLADLIASSPHNLVSARERERLRTTHVEECLQVGRCLAPLVEPGARWIDLGTGGGLPGLILALQLPDTQWLLVDATAKKVAAVEGFISSLGVVNAGARLGRAEELARASELRAACDGVVARACAPLRTLAELARGFVGPGGLLAAIKGPSWEAELADAQRALERCRWVVERVEPVGGAPRPTSLVVLRAEGPPPDEVPRRVGVPERRPW